MNQPASLNGELVKQSINPTKRHHTLLARNVQLRDYLLMGSPSTDAECPEGLSMQDMSYISHAVKPPATMPEVCRSVNGLIGGAEAGQTQVIRLEWTWDAVHRPDATFNLVLRVLGPKFVGGGGGKADRPRTPITAVAWELPHAGRRLMVDASPLALRRGRHVGQSAQRRRTL